ncbi:MGMT family protein [Salinimonas marina]|uniref:MGMT family protein n=1 Tax=Salinimonas marina TaxID=2785918 RepID=A0A7S9DX89_9ALTE|nr:MGMT family protein [Salinimonas marina]
MPNMTPGQQIVATIEMIPSGYVVSYGQIADLAGLPGRARLVGSVLKAHSQASLPWHRVVRASGAIAFAAGSEQAHEQRQRLLAEGVAIKGHKVVLPDYLWRPDMYTLLYKLQA